MGARSLVNDPDEHAWMEAQEETDATALRAALLARRAQRETAEASATAEAEEELRRRYSTWAEGPNGRVIVHSEAEKCALLGTMDAVDAAPSPSNRGVTVTGERRDRILLLLDQSPSLSNREIARQVGVSDKTVAGIRNTRAKTDGGDRTLA